MAVLGTLQTGTAQIAATGSVANITITSVDTSATLFSWGARLETNRPDRGSISARMVSPTSLQFRRSAAVAPAANIFWYVAEFSTNVSTQYRNASPVTATTMNVLINSVSPSKSAIFTTWNNGGGNYTDDDFFASRLQSATSAQFLVTTTPNVLPLGIEFQIFECSDCTVQTGNMTWVAATANSTMTITSVDTTKAVLWLSYFSDDGSITNYAQKQVLGSFSSPTVVRFTRQSSGQNLSLYWQVIEFTDGTTVQLGTAVFATTTTLTNVTITSVATDRSVSFLSGMAGRGGMGTNIGDDNVGPYSFTHRLTSPTNLELYRETTGNLTAFVSWQVVQFDTAAAVAVVELESSYIVIA